MDETLGRACPWSRERRRWVCGLYLAYVVSESLATLPGVGGMSQGEDEMGKERWTIKQLSNHIKLNSSNTYSMAVVLDAMYLLLYGDHAKGIGLSGAQAEFAELIVRKLPRPNPNASVMWR